MRWTWHIACIGQMINVHIKYYSENLNKRNHLGDLGVNERVILNYILNKHDVMMWTKFIWLRIGTSNRFFFFVNIVTNLQVS
jgi:hypothetical protein